MDRTRERVESAVGKGRTPGIHYLVIGPEGVRRAHHAGSADLARGWPMRPETTLMAYSMSKTFTAAAVLGLVQSGSLDLDRPLGGTLGLPSPLAAITTRQLLSHTSGLPAPIPLRWVHPASAHAGFDEAAALAGLLRRHGRLVSAPGARYRYSNIGYWLLGRVVEQVTGGRFMDHLRAQVLEPLGLTPEDLSDRIPDPGRHASGYLERWSLMDLLKGALLDSSLIGEYHGRWLTIRPHHVNGAAFGGLLGTAGAFARFLQDQLSPHSLVLDDATRELFFEPQCDGRGRPTPMTLGWHVGRLGRDAHHFKEGGGGGFHCMMRLYRDRGVGTLVMVNATGFDTAAFLDEADPVWLG